MKAHRSSPPEPPGAERHPILDGATLAERLADDPALLGHWARLIFGDQVTLTPQRIDVTFPPLLHIGFRRAVEPAELLGWLAREQATLRQIVAALDIGSRERFDVLAELYRDWATLQAQVGWQSPDEDAFAARLQPFASPVPAKRERLGDWLGQLRRNRAQLIDALHTIDLRREQGQLVTSGAGAVYSRFGQPLTVQPHDGRALYEMLFRRLRRLVAAGGNAQQLGETISAAALPALRGQGRPPAAAAWLPLDVEGRLALVEPFAADHAGAVADFYAPFAWSAGGVRLRLGHPRYGLSSDELARALCGVDRAASTPAQLRRAPVPLSGHGRAQLWRVVDEPERWPLFTAHRLELDGEPSAPARWHGDHEDGLYQQLVVVRGEVELSDAAGGTARLEPDRPAFIPATLRGGYHLEARGAATLLLLALPGPQRSFSF
jgi:hypothetical protein